MNISANCLIFGPSGGMISALSISVIKQHPDKQFSSIVTLEQCKHQSIGFAHTFVSICSGTEKLFWYFVNSFITEWKEIRFTPKCYMYPLHSHGDTENNDKHSFAVTFYSKNRKAVWNTSVFIEIQITSIWIWMWFVKWILNWKKKNRIKKYNGRKGTHLSVFNEFKLGIASSKNFAPQF